MYKHNKGLRLIQIAVLYLHKLFKNRNFLLSNPLLCLYFTVGKH